ncbi:MAG: fibronectin type III domain-containing protein [Bacteroidales bacterium]|nr:fibronectin type III domain-containing protein [Bacteroidales bacterium]
MKNRNVVGITLALLACMSTGMGAVKARGIDSNPLMLFNFEDGQVSNWRTANVGRGERQSVELARTEDGDPVRFGNRAIRLNFDMTDAQTSQTLCCSYDPGTGAFTIPAGPNGARKLGMWVYATPEAQGIWMRVQMTNLDTGGLVSVFDGEPTIDWIGWKYVEFGFPASANNVPLGPRSNSFIRLLSIDSGTTGPMTNGYIIVDDIRVSHVEEDTVPPTVATLTGNGSHLNGQTFTTGQVDISAAFNDNHSGISSGINHKTVRITVDGFAFKAGDAGFSVQQDAHIVSLKGLNLSDGLHHVEVYVEDNFGNMGTKAASFTVNTGKGAAVSIVPSGSQVRIGSVYTLQLNTNNPSNVKEIDVTIQLNNTGSVDEWNGVEFARSVKEGVFRFNPRLGHLTVHLKNDAAVTAAGTLATINISIKKNGNAQDVFRCAPVSAKVTHADGSFSTFTFNPIETRLWADYDFTVVKRIVGAPGEVLVTDPHGNPQSGVRVHILAADRTPIESAVTGQNGIASGLTAFTSEAQNVYIYAEKDGKYSYTGFLKSLRPLLTNAPTHIRAGTTPNPTTSKTITWMSNPLTSTGPAIMKVAKKSEGVHSFKPYEGKVKFMEYDGTGSDWVGKANSVTVNNLEAGTTYIYQVGDGTNWSPTMEFTTAPVTDKFSFSAFGDLQASTMEHMNRFFAAATTIEAMPARPLFSLNVADIVDTDDRYEYYYYYATMFDRHPVFANIDMVTAYGNHEYMGTLNADNVKFTSGTPTIEPSDKYDAQLIGSGSYAVEYGNMLVIALDWAGRSGHEPQTYQQEQAKWLEEILSKTNKTWKIVTLHYPIFPAADHSSSQTILAPVFDKYNVQLVFCGHGHTFERVQVYEGNYLVPITDRRTFEPVIGGTLHFQLGGMKETNRNGRWVFCEVDGGKMTVTVRDANNNIVPEECFILYAYNPKN